MITKASILRSIAYHSPHERLINEAADDVETLARLRAIIDEARADRQRQPYDAMGTDAGIPLSKLISALSPR